MSWLAGPDGGRLTRCRRGIGQSRWRRCSDLLRRVNAGWLRWCGTLAMLRMQAGRADNVTYCDPAGAVLRLFRRATNGEKRMAQTIVDELRVDGLQGGGDAAEKRRCGGPCEPGTNLMRFSMRWFVRG